MQNKQQRAVICMYDGFGSDYYEWSHLPVMKDMARQGVMKRGRAIFPTLTNANNISICCASWPAEHGVTTNCYFDEATGTARFLEDAKFILTPTIFNRFRDKGIRSALLTCKAKTLLLVGGDADIAVAAESPSQEVIEKYGPPPPMYSTEVNYWLWKIAVDILSSQPDIGLLYVHTTDYPMHMWGPEEAAVSDPYGPSRQIAGRSQEGCPGCAFSDHRGPRDEPEKTVHRPS